MFFHHLLTTFRNFMIILNNYFFKKISLFVALFAINNLFAPSMQADYELDRHRITVKKGSTQAQVNALWERAKKRTLSTQDDNGNNANSTVTFTPPTPKKQKRAISISLYDWFQRANHNERSDDQDLFLKDTSETLRISILKTGYGFKALVSLSTSKNELDFTEAEDAQEWAIKVAVNNGLNLKQRKVHFPGWLARHGDFSKYGSI